MTEVLSVSTLPAVLPDTPVPLVDLPHQHRLIADEVAAGFERVMQKGCFTDGPDVGEFEKEFAAYSGAAHVVGAASGTDALEIALRCAGIRPSDEVIVPANTFAATAEAVLRIGAQPVFVDVDPDTLLIDPARIEAAINTRTTAVIPVHLYGRLAPLAPLQALAEQHHLILVADAAQSQGARDPETGAGIAVGVSAAATSFYPGKNLGAYGDAGAVVTDDPEMATLARSMTRHGVDGDRYTHVRFGFTSRLDTLQAVVLRAKLARLDDWNAQRRAAAAIYHELLRDAPEQLVRPAASVGPEHVWHLYVVRVPERDRILATLQAGGIGAGAHYPIPLHRQPAYASLPHPACPNAERAAASVLSLPLFPGITESQQVRVVDALLNAL